MNKNNIFMKYYKPLYESFKSNAVSLLFNVALNESKKDYIRIIAVDPNGKLWYIVDFYNGNKLDLEHSRFKKLEFGLTFDMMNNSNFLGEISDDSIYQKLFIDKDTLAKYLKREQVSLQDIIKLALKNKAFCIVITSLDYKTVFGGLLLNNSSDILKFFNKQQERTNNREGNKDKAIAYLNKIILNTPNLQKQFILKYSQDKYNRLLEIVKNFNKQGFLKYDTTNSYINAAFGTSNDNANAKKYVLINLLNFLMTYGLLDDNKKDDAKKNILVFMNKQNMLLQTQLIMTKGDKLMKAFDAEFNKK